MMEIKFKQERITKNTVRFQEQTTDEPAIGYLYVQKKTLKAMGYNVEKPETLTVTLEVRG